MLDNVGEARLSCSVCSVRAVCTPAGQRACVRGPKTVSGWRAPSPGYQTQLLSWCRTLGESAGTAWYASNIFMQLLKIFLLTRHSCPGSVPLLPPLQLSWPGVSSQGGCLVPGAWSRFPWMIILNTLQDWSDCPDAQTTPALNRLLFVKIHHRGIQLQPVQQMRRVGWWIFLYEAISIWAECVWLMYGHEEKVWGPGEGHQPCLSCLGGYWGRPSLDCGVLSC